MRTRYIAALNGIELGEISPSIFVTDIAYSPPVREIKTAQIDGRNGQVLQRTITGSVSVEIRFEIHEQSVRRRAEIMEEVQRWAMGGGELNTGDMPDKRLRVICERIPTISSALKWTQTCSVGFTAYATPFWEDMYPQKSTISGNGSVEVYTPGFAAPAEVECDVKNIGTSAITSVIITAGDTAMSFSGIFLSAGKTLKVGHDDRGLLTAGIEGTSALAKRTASSSDELELKAGERGNLSVEANGKTQTTFFVRGRYA